MHGYGRSAELYNMENWTEKKNQHLAWRNKNDYDNKCVPKDITTFELTGIKDKRIRE